MACPIRRPSTSPIVMHYELECMACHTKRYVRGIPGSANWFKLKCRKCGRNDMWQCNDWITERALQRLAEQAKGAK